MGLFANPGRATFDALRSPSLAAATYFLPVTPRAAVWDVRGAVARPQEVGCRSGAAGVENVY